MFFQDNAFKRVVYKKAAISFRPEYVTCELLTERDVKI